MKKIIVVGSGLAGCFLADELQDICDVTIITKGTKKDSNSMLAQGGIAVSLDEGDTPFQHEKDTLKAGQYQNYRPAVEQLVVKGRELVGNLIENGMCFDKNPDGTLSFGLEGAHSFHRVLHANGDQTGKAITTFVQSKLHNVTWKEKSDVISLEVKNGQCCGVLVRNLDTNEQKIIYADAIILATGGLGNLYSFTTNNKTITGDGIALAYRAGAEVSDMEFVQFHPTLLSIDNHCYGLITEAIRGAGAILIDENGTKIMENVTQKDLAPRDVVARHLFEWQAKGHKLFLDISKVQNFKDKFPGVSANLIKHHVDFEKTNLIPIQPGAHFMMGGIKTDLQARTTIKRLFAVGEAACNGVHGANRLASNSLLDCLVSAKKAADEIKSLKQLKLSDEKVVSNGILNVNLPTLQKLQEMSWKYLGVERTREGLKSFINWIDKYEYDKNLQKLSNDDITKSNLSLCAKLIAKQALTKKSVGAHFLKDEVKVGNY